MKIIKIAVIAIILIISKTAYTQDYHLSLIDDAPVIMNPSLAGTYDGTFRFHLQHRSQWKSILSKSFLTEVFSAEMTLRPFGTGIVVLNNRAGTGSFNQFSMYATGSYEVTIDPGKYHHLFCGVHLGFIQNSINISSLTFDNQYTMSGGGGFDVNLPTGENFTKTSDIAPDVNFGISYIAMKKMNYFSSFVYKTSTWTPYAGITGFHLTQPKLEFSDYKNKIYRRWLMYAGVRYKINTDICVDPNILWENQAKVNDFKFGAYGYYYIGAYQVFAMAGIHYRVKDAVSISMGGLYKQYALKFAYDINTSKLNTITRGKGGFEISFTYSFLSEQSYSLL